MSSTQDRHTWAIVRLLFSTYLPFMVLGWVAFVVVVAAITAGIAIFGDVTRSVWDPAASFLRWLAFGYGLYLTNRLLPMYVAHGRARREFMIQATLFIVVTGAVLAALIAFGYALETLLYRAMGWSQAVLAQRPFSAAGQFLPIFGSFWAMLLVWTITGTLLAAGFYRPGGWVLIVVPLALALVIGVGVAIGFSGLPVVGTVVDMADLPLLTTVALCGGGFLIGVAMTGVLVRDIPIRNRTG
jgi:hypothetical protein